MPYVITTSRATCDAAECREHRSASRRAVATLEEARRVALTIADEHEDKMWSPAMLAAVYEFSGEGTVGPLPDGTVIEVARATIEKLMHDAGLDARDPRPDAEIIDAYNVAQS